jgi:hypothetical protein
MKKPQDTHPDDVVNEMLDVATKYGYRVAALTLIWESGIPNSEIMEVKYGNDKPS